MPGQETKTLAQAPYGAKPAQAAAVKPTNFNQQPQGFSAPQDEEDYDDAFVEEEILDDYD